MSKVGFWLKGSTGKLAGTTLYKGGGQAVADSGSGSGGTTPAASFAIGSTTVNGQTLTVGTNSTIVASGDTADLSIRVRFTNVGTAQSVLLFKGDTQVGTEHAINGNAAEFSAAGAALGSYSIKVKKADNTLVASGYVFSVEQSGSGGEGGADQN